MKLISTRIAAVALTLAGVALFGAPQARADANPTPRPGASLGGRASYIWPRGADSGNGSWMGGAQLRFYLAKWFGVEGSVDYRQQRFGAASVTSDIYPVQVTGLLYVLPNSPVSPYLLGGAGWYFTHTRGPSGTSQTTNKMGEHVGGGIQFFMARHWSIDADYRYIFTDRITVQGNGASVIVNGDSHLVTGALNYHF